MKVVSLIVAIWQLVARYPAVTAGVFQVIIVAGAAVGLNLTTAELASIAGLVASVFAVLVHAGVIPVTKVSNVKAGVKPTVPSAVEVGEPLSATVPAAQPVAYTPTAPSPVLVSPNVSVVADTVSVEHGVDAKPEPVTFASGGIVSEPVKPEPMPEPESSKPLPGSIATVPPDGGKLGKPITPIGKRKNV